ncbi:HNH endonuclease [Aeromicrobium sp. CF4.19]|uniref:HNH endonuclease n=1 Tax=Aeromicrobium sp. CF4.19 TaxID=3373082 RepID=UPI003EE4E3E8
MTDARPPAAWLLMAVGENRQYGGNTGYDDQADVYYSWDSTVNNHANVRVGDSVAIWDKERLLGLSVIEAIEAESEVKALRRCANAQCGRSNINERRTKAPRFRCQNCGFEFDEPATSFVEVTKYTSRHDAAWTPLENLLSGPELRQLCKSPKSQLSMRPLDWDAFSTAISQHGAHQALKRVADRSPDLFFPSQADTSMEFSQGHSEALVRVRRGQRKFRDQLLKTYGGRCAFTGEAPKRVLDAGHLYSYAQLGEHFEHGGLLLRRDVHRLFDDGSLAVHPGTLKVDVGNDLETFPQYARLHDRPLAVQVNDERVEWLQKHWNEHR